MLFTPTVEEMYPEGTGADDGGGVRDLRRMEGASAAHAFRRGVARSWRSCSTSSAPCRAYFGEKDYQQLAVVRRMAHDLSFPVEVIG